MSGRVGKSVHEALTEISDFSLLQLKEEHKRDPLWSHFKFGDWVNTKMAFKQQQGYARGFRKGVKMGLAQFEHERVPTFSVGALTWAWAATLPVLAAANALMLPLAVQYVVDGSWLRLVILLLVLPIAVTLQFIGTGFIARRFWYKVINKPDDGDVIVVKIPVSSSDEDEDATTQSGQEQIADAIRDGDANRNSN